MKFQPNSKNAIRPFKHIRKFSISKNQDDGSIDLFLLPVNARNFDYQCVIDNLLESVADYSLSWKIRKDYNNKAMTLSKKAREKFKVAKKNEGELGELLLFCFLEGFLEAPKILTKLSLKTSQNVHINGSDAVHLKKISDERYHLIFGESKTYSNLSRAFSDAFKSIREFKEEINLKGNKKSGIAYEKGLISSNVEADIFEDEDKEILDLLIYPEKRGNNKIKLDDAFSIFVGYQIDIKNEQIKCSNRDFQVEIENKVKSQIENFKDKIYKKIIENNLIGHSFYIFIVPFTEIEKNRKEILKGILD